MLQYFLHCSTEGGYRWGEVSIYLFISLNGFPTDCSVKSHLYFWHYRVCFNLVFLWQVINSYYLTLLVIEFNKDGPEKAFVLDSVRIYGIIYGNTKGQQKLRYLTIFSHLVVLISHPQYNFDFVSLLLFHRLTRSCTNTSWGSLMMVIVFSTWWSSSKQHMESAQCCWETTQLLVQHDSF